MTVRELGDFFFRRLRPRNFRAPSPPQDVAAQLEVPRSALGFTDEKFEQEVAGLVFGPELNDRGMTVSGGRMSRV